MAGPYMSRTDTGKLYVEQESSFGAGLPAVPPTNVYSPNKPMDLSGLEEKYHERGELVTWNVKDQGVIGAKSDSKIGLSFFMQPLESAVPFALPALACPQYVSGTTPRCEEVVAHALGTRWAYNGAPIASVKVVSWAPGTLELEVDDSSGFTEGELICICDHNAVPPSNKEVARIVNIDAGTDILTLSAPLLMAPIADDLVFGSIMHWLPDVPQPVAMGGRLQSMAMYFHSCVKASNVPADGYLAYEMKGMQATGFKISWNPTDFAEMAVDFNVADWVETIETAMPAAVVPNAPNRQAIVGAWCYFFNRVTLESGSFRISSCEVDFGIESKIPKQISGDVQGVGARAFGICKPRISLKPLFREDALAWYKAGDDIDLRIQIGPLPGRMFAIQAPAARLVQTPLPADQDGQAVQVLEFEPQLYRGDYLTAELPLGPTGSAFTPADLLPIDSSICLAFI